MSRTVRLLLVCGSAALVLAGCGGSSNSSDTTTSGGVTTSSTAKGTPVAVTVGDNPDGTQFLNVSPDSVPAGRTTFTVTNSGSKAHEMVVLTASESSLTVGSDNKVSESTSVGEVDEVPKGSMKSVTLDLKPGMYTLACNLEKHYGNGMHTMFMVT